jgi:hypothetical protein
MGGWWEPPASGALPFAEGEAGGGSGNSILLSFFLRICDILDLRIFRSCDSLDLRIFRSCDSLDM